MLRWLTARSSPLSGASSCGNLITDDPLAALDKRQRLYSVSRLNPVFSEELAAEYDAGYQSQQASEQGSESPVSARKFVEYPGGPPSPQYQEIQERSRPASEPPYDLPSVHGRRASIDTSTCQHPRGDPHTVTCQHPRGDPHAVTCQHPRGDPHAVTCQHPRGDPHAVTCQRPREDAHTVTYDGAPGCTSCNRVVDVKSATLPLPVWPASQPRGQDAETAVLHRHGSAEQLTSREYAPHDLRDNSARHFSPAFERPIVQTFRRPLPSPLVSAYSEPYTGAPPQLSVQRQHCRPNLPPPVCYGPDSIVTDSLLVLTTPADDQLPSPEPNLYSLPVLPPPPDGFGPDSIVTDSLLVLTRPSSEVQAIESAASSSQPPAVDVLQQFSHTLANSRPMSAVRKANLGVRSSIGSDIGSVSSLLSAASSAARPDPATLTDPVAFVMQLWERTGMRTNGRKLLVNEHDAPRAWVPSIRPHRTSASHGDRTSARLPISGGWMERVSVSSEERVTPTLLRSGAATGYLNQVLPPCSEDTGDGRQPGGGSEASDGSSERRVTFSADTVDNENSSGRLRRLYETRSLSQPTPPLPPPSELQLNAAQLAATAARRTTSPDDRRPLQTAQHSVYGTLSKHGTSNKSSTHWDDELARFQFAVGTVKTRSWLRGWCGLGGSRCVWVVILLVVGVLLLSGVLWAFQWLMSSSPHELTEATVYAVQDAPNLTLGL